MAVHTKVTSLIITLMATEPIDGLTVEHILASGRTIKCMVMDFLPGKMVDLTTENT